MNHDKNSGPEVPDGNAACVTDLGSLSNEEIENRLKDFHVKLDALWRQSIAARDAHAELMVVGETLRVEHQRRNGARSKLTAEELASQRRGRSELQRLRKEQRDLEKWAADQLVPWGPLQDADFLPLTKEGALKGVNLPKSAMKDFHSAATIYEFARESRRVRGLALMLHQIWTARREAQAERSRPKKLSRWRYSSARFENVTEDKLRNSIGDWTAFLGEIGDLLAKNKPFVHAWRDDRPRIEWAIWMKHPKTGALIRRPTVTFSRQIPAVEPAMKEALSDVSCCWEFGWDRKGQPLQKRSGLSKNGVEVVAFRINWKDCLDKQITEFFEQFVAHFRPKRFPEPFDGRIENQPQRWSEGLRFMQAMRRVWAEAEGDLASKFSKVNRLWERAKKARELFVTLFPFEKPAHEIAQHGRTFRQRQPKAAPKKRERGWKIPDHWN
jgi:hypothetical protein